MHPAGHHQRFRVELFGLLRQLLDVSRLVGIATKANDIGFETANGFLECLDRGFFNGQIQIFLDIFGRHAGK